MANELNDANNTQGTEQNTDKGTDSKNLEARIKELEAENGKLRQANTNASADASKHKKAAEEWREKYQSKLSEEDKAKEQQDEATAAMQKELEELRNERNIAKYTGALVAQDIGMDSETAKSVAEALNAGEIDKVFDGIRKFITTHDKTLRENSLRNNQTLLGGNSTDKPVTKEEFDKMSYREMVVFKQNHPEQYAEFMKK
jgi:tellurite resistance protein